MRIIPDKIKEIAANEGCNHVESVGTLDNKKVYSIHESREDSLNGTTGFPRLIVWDGKDYITITGTESLDILEQFDL